MRFLHRLFLHFPQLWWNVTCDIWKKKTRRLNRSKITQMCYKGMINLSQSGPLPLFLRNPLLSESSFLWRTLIFIKHFLTDALHQQLLWRLANESVTRALLLYYCPANWTIKVAFTVRPQGDNCHHEDVLVKPWLIVPCFLCMLMSLIIIKFIVKMIKNRLWFLTNVPLCS